MFSVVMKNPGNNQKCAKALVVVGQGEDTVFQTLSLVHHIGSGLVVAQQAKGVVRGSFDRNLGGIGEAGLPPIVMEADCIILIGNASYEKKYFPKNAKLVHLAERPSDINVNAQGAASGDLGLLIEAIMHDLGLCHQGLVEQVGEHCASSNL